MGLNWVKKNKIPIIIILIFFLFMITVWTSYNFYGHQLIKAMYDGRSIEFLNKIVEGQSEYSLDYYLEKADRLFPEIISLIFIFLLVFSASYVFISIVKVKYQKPTIAEWIYLICGLFFTQWYFWFLDDAFIYFRYIDNFLFLDIGLIYNKGENVEGFSSPFWVILLSLVRATGVSYWFAVRLIGGISLVLFWFMLVQLNGKLSPKTSVINFPLVYLTFNYGVYSYFTSGMETPLVQIIAVAYALYILNPSSRVLQIIMALSPLIRHELIIPFVLCSMWTWRYNKEFPLRMILMTIAFVGSWVLFRIYYYADLFPNTFYLKDVVDIKQGFIYVHQVFKTYHFYTVAVIFVILIALLKKKNEELELSKRFMMVIAALSVTLYVIKIGGDQVHYKYLAFPFILMVCALSGILEHFIETFGFNKYKFLNPLAEALIALVVFTFYPPQIDRHPFFIDVGVTPVNKIYEAAKHRQRPGSKYHQWSGEVNIEIMQKYKNENMKFKYEETERAFGCFLSYVHFYKRIIHGLGLTEPILARTKMKIDTPAHKEGLKPLGDDIVFIHETSEKIGRGMYRKAVNEGRAPEWIRKNLETIEIIERKTYNTHNFMENLKLAFTFPSKIKP